MNNVIVDKTKLIKLSIAIGIIVLVLSVNGIINHDKLYIIPMNILSVILLTGVVFICWFLIHYYCEIKYRKTVLYLWGIVSLIGFAIYFFIIMNREMSYTDDHTVYYNSYFELRNLFYDSPIKGFAGIVSSSWQSDYSYFITVLLSLPFSFTDLSHESHILCYYCAFIIPFYLSVNILAINIATKAKVKNIRIFLVMANLCMLLFPLLHFAAILGMPDIFGLFFCFTIIILLFNLSFEKFNIKVAASLSILVILLILTRRWYIFFLIGFLPTIFIFVFLDSLVNKTINAKTIIINEAKTIAFLGGCTLIALAPFVYRTLFVRNYSEEYSAWYLGGFPFELYNQLGYLGILLAIILFIGMIYGILEKRLRVLTLSCIAGFLLTVFSFTLIQNMGKHQSLCLFPYYTVFLYNFIIMSNKRKNRIVRIGLNILLLAVFVLNAFSSIFIWYDDLGGVFLLTKYAVASRFNWTF